MAEYAMSRSLDTKLANLSDRRRRFVLEYLKDCNGAAAYRRAGYKAKSNQVAAAGAERLLRNVDIARAVRVAQHEQSERLELTADMVLEGLHREATLKGKGSSHSARVSAWGLLGKHQGLFPEKREIYGKGGGPIEIASEPRTLAEAEAQLRSELGSDVA